MYRRYAFDRKTLMPAADLVIDSHENGLIAARALGGEVAIGFGQSLISGLASINGSRVSASRWSVWLWVEVTRSIKSRRAGRDGDSGHPHVRFVAPGVFVSESLR